MTDEEWGRVKGWIAAAIAEGGNTYTLDDIKAAIDADKIALVTLRHSAVLLEIISYPQCRALRVLAVGGEGNEALRELQIYAQGIPELTKQLGCTRFEGRGRPGWMRALRGLGMKSHIFLFKDID